MTTLRFLYFGVFRNLRIWAMSISIGILKLCASSITRISGTFPLNWRSSSRASVWIESNLVACELAPSPVLYPTVAFLYERSCLNPFSPLWHRSSCEIRFAFNSSKNSWLCYNNFFSWIHLSKDLRYLCWFSTACFSLYNDDIMGINCILNDTPWERNRETCNALHHINTLLCTDVIEWGRKNVSLSIFSYFYNSPFGSYVFSMVVW